MSGTRRNIQYSLALEPRGRGEALGSGSEGTEPLVAKPGPESPALAEQLMEEVCDRENLERAWKRVQRNKGGPGVDGMTIDDAKDYLREHWPGIRVRLLERAKNSVGCSGCDGWGLGVICGHGRVPFAERLRQSAIQGLSPSLQQQVGAGL